MAPCLQPGHCVAHRAGPTKGPLLRAHRGVARHPGHWRRGTEPRAAMQPRRRASSAPRAGHSDRTFASRHARLGRCGQGAAKVRLHPDARCDRACWRTCCAARPRARARQTVADARVRRGRGRDPGPARVRGRDHCGHGRCGHGRCGHGRCGRFARHGRGHSATASETNPRWARGCGAATPRETKLGGAPKVHRRGPPPEAQHGRTRPPRPESAPA